MNVLMGPVITITLKQKETVFTTNTSTPQNRKNQVLQEQLVMWVENHWSEKRT